jgi:hypothetical protein
MVGRLEIQRIRAAAEAALGPVFDIRGFNDTVLCNGALPLGVLAEVVDGWSPRRRPGCRTPDRDLPLTKMSGSSPRQPACWTASSPSSDQSSWGTVMLTMRGVSARKGGSVCCAALKWSEPT